ncbi:hypothetical protein ANO14919_089560 [Xylariales sp. No.14919]|nr:hypothetical protein ANO14919_089560 [Xylariales sp. No.14919]
MAALKAKPEEVQHGHRHYLADVELAAEPHSR